MTKVSSAVMFPTAATVMTSGQLRCAGGESTATELQCGELTATEESVGSSSLLVTKQLSPILTTRSSQLSGVNSTISRSRGRGRRSSSGSSSSSSYSPPNANSIPSPSLSSSSSSSSSRLFGSSSDEEWDCLDSSSATSSPYTSEEEEEEEEEAVTPRAKEYRIPELLFCPPAPRKPRIGDSNRICGGAATNAGGSFFAVPDLDHTFLTMRAPAFV